MRAGKKLRGKHIAVLAADGFEKVELTIPLRALKAAGAKVDIVSLRQGRIRGVNLHEPAGRVHVDLTLDLADPLFYDGLLIPGGLLNPDLLRQSRLAREFVRAFDDAKKPIAAICHAPWVLASAALLDGRCLTSWPGIRDDLVYAGATWFDEPIVRDGNLVTSRGPQDLVPFVRAILELYSEEAPILSGAPGYEYSSPQHDEPPAIVLKTLKWMPRPSFRTAVGLGIVAAGISAFNSWRRAA